MVYVLLVIYIYMYIMHVGRVIYCISMKNRSNIEAKVIDYIYNVTYIADGSIVLIEQIGLNHHNAAFWKTFTWKKYKMMKEDEAVTYKYIYIYIYTYNPSLN